MYSITIICLMFCSINFGYLMAKEEDDELKELVIPADHNGEVDENQSSLRGVFKRFHTIFLRKQLQPSTSEVTLSDRLWSTTTQLISSPKYWFMDNPYPKVCESKWDGSKARLTKYGEEQCSKKCVAENKVYVEQANAYFPHLCKIMNKSHLRARFESTEKDIYKCVPGLIYGFTCICKHSARVLVNADLQTMVDQVYAITKDEENSGNVGPNKGSDNTDGKLVQFVGRFLGLLATLVYFPTWLGPYVALWTNGMK